MLIVHMQRMKIYCVCLNWAAQSKFNMAFVKFEIIIIRMPTILNSILIYEHIPNLIEKYSRSEK